MSKEESFYNLKEVEDIRNPEVTTISGSSTETIVENDSGEMVFVHSLEFFRVDTDAKVNITANGKPIRTGFTLSANERTKVPNSESQSKEKLYITIYSGSKLEIEETAGNPCTVAIRKTKRR